MQKIKQVFPSAPAKLQGKGLDGPEQHIPDPSQAPTRMVWRQFALRVGPLATEGHGSVHKICYFTVSTICVDADGVPATELVAVTVMV